MERAASARIRSRAAAFSRHHPGIDKHNARTSIHIVPPARFERHAPHRQAPPGQLHGRPRQLGQAAGPVRVLLLHRRLARAHHRLRRPLADCGQHAGRGAGLPGRGPGPGTKHDVSAEPGPAARRTEPAAGHDYAAGLAGARTHLQGDAGEPVEQGPDRPTASSVIRC